MSSQQIESTDSRMLADRARHLADLEGIDRPVPSCNCIEATCKECDTTIEVDSLPAGFVDWIGWVCHACGEPMELLVPCPNCSQLNRRRGGWLGYFLHNPRHGSFCSICGFRLVGSNSFDQPTVSNSHYGMSVSTQYFLHAFAIGGAGLIFSLIAAAVLTVLTGIEFVLSIPVVGLCCGAGYGVYVAWDKHRSGLLFIGRPPDYLSERTIERLAEEVGESSDGCGF